jgi:hypothetical protein
LHFVERKNQGRKPDKNSSMMSRNLDKSRIPSQDMGMTSSYGKEVTLTLCRECGEAELLKNVSIC